MTNTKLHERLTKNQIIAELRRLGWHRKNWRWFKATHPVGKRGVMLRDAASFELLESNENLYEGRHHD